MGVTDGNILFYHVHSEQRRDKKLSMRGYNYRAFCDCFKSPFPVYCGIPYLNIPPMPIDDSPCPNKISHYTPDLLPAAIYVASETSVSTFTNPYDSPGVIVLTSNAPKIEDCGKLKIGYCTRRHGRIRCYKRTRFFCTASFYS